MNSKSNTFSLFEKLFSLSTLIPIFSLLYLMGRVLLSFDRSLDFTDESNAILCADNFSIYKASVSQFGNYTGILYSLAGGDLYIFRLLSFFMLMVVSLVFATCLDNYLSHFSKFEKCFFIRFGRLSTILLATLCYYYRWIPSPTYNWLALFSCLLTYSGLLLGAESTIKGDRFSSDWCLSHVFGAFFVGVGGGLAFMAKPTTAAALAIIGLVWIFTSRLRTYAFRFLFCSLASMAFFVLFHIFIFEGGVAQFYVKMINGLGLAGTLGAGHEIAVLLQRVAKFWGKVPLHIYSLFSHPLLLVVLIVSSTAFFSRRVIVREVASASILLSSWFVCWKSGFWSGGATKFGHTLSTGGIFFCLISFLLFVLYCFRSSDGTFKNIFEHIEIFSLSIFLFVGPLAYSFGNAGNIVNHQSGAFVFFISSCFTFLYSLYIFNPATKIPNIFAIVVAVIVVLVFQGAFSSPHRTAPISEQNTLVTLGLHQSSIYVDKRSSEYILGLRFAATRSGWKGGTPLIDLTGTSPGAAVVLGAKAPGSPWLLGGYPGSGEFAVAALKYADKEDIGRAWVLASPKGKRSLSDTVLRSFGIPFPGRYELVGKVLRPISGEEQFLYRPL